MQGVTIRDGDFELESFDCVCGAHHEAPVRRVVVRPGALDEVVPIITELGLGRRVVMVSDRNTEAAAGAAVAKRLESDGFQVGRCFFDTGEWVRPDEHAVGSLMFSMEPDTELLVAVGSGALTDVTRFVSSRTGVPFVSVATAPSVDGYTSNGAPITHNGYKRTLVCGQPVAVVADTDVLTSAPHSMIASGFSDTLAKLTAWTDWQLSRIVTGEYYCPTIVDGVTTAARACMDAADGIGSSDPSAVQTLSEALMISGIAMTMIGNSRPASGSEHSLSHYWEMKAHLEDRPEYLHGTKVGVATAIIAAFHERFFARLENAARDRSSIDRDALERGHPSLEQVEERVRGVLGSVADRVIAEVVRPEYRDWPQRNREISAILDNAGEIIALRAGAPTYDALMDAQRRAGAPATPEEIGVGPDYLAETLRNAMEVRLRFTVLRAAESLGWLDDLADEVVELVCG